MRAARPVVVLALLALGALLAALALDVLRWRDGMVSGDREFARSPASAGWHVNAILPSDPARDVLGLGTALRFRSAEQAFSAVQAAGRGYDNGLSESRTRGGLESELATLGQSRNHAIASAADNLLGILAFADSTQSGPIAPAPVDQAVADFQAAVRLDPTNPDAKYNLELLLRQLLAKGVRKGANNSTGGTARGHRGAGGGLPGRGY